MKFKNYLFSFLAATLFFAPNAWAQSPNLAGGNSTVFSNTDPCVLDVEFQYTNTGSVGTGPFKSGLYLTTDLFTADPLWDILVGESSNGVGCAPGEFRVTSFTNQDISQLPGFQSGQTYYVYVYLDSGEQVQESDEGDNLYSVGNTTCTVVGILNPQAANIEVNIGPNPASNEMSISIETGNHDPITLQIIDAQGKTVLAQQFESGADRMLDLDVSNWANGIYWAQVTMGNHRVTKKVIITK